MYLTEELQKKWEKVLNHPDLPSVQDSHKRAVLTVLLENQESEARKERGILTETHPVNHGGLGTTSTLSATGGSGSGNANVQAYDPVLISLVRRALPNLMAFDVCGVQPMRAPTGLIFAMRSKYEDQGNREALFREAETGFSGDGAANATDPFAANATIGGGLRSDDGERLGSKTNLSNGSEKDFPEMAFSIDKVSVEAKTRALKAEYTMELAQDLRSVHGLDAETELANILSAEILAEINREVIRTVYKVAKIGAQHSGLAGNGNGEFDLDVDANGRWSVEKYKGLMVQLEREANQIAKETRRGRGNIIICDADTASALSVAGLLDCGSALKDNLSVDDTGNTFVGVLNGRFKVYIDPFANPLNNFAVVGFKGANQYDAGLFYCPYVPLQMVRAVDTGSFQPKIGFKTRYGLVANPFAAATSGSNEALTGALTAGTNAYYRKIKIKNLL